MKIEKAKILDIVTSSIGDFNDISDVQLEAGDDGVYALYGRGAALSSVDLVVLLTIVEDEVGTAFDTDFSFNMDKAVSLKESPFETSDKLVAFIIEEIAESGVEA